MEPFKITVSIDVGERNVMDNIINHSGHTYGINDLKITIFLLNEKRITKEPVNQNFSFKKKLLNMKNSLYPKMPIPTMKARKMNIFAIGSLYSI